MPREKKKFIILPADDSFDMTFIALMLLLLCFMVIMVSMAQLDDPRFREAIGSVKGALSFLTHAESQSLALDGSPGVLTQRGEDAKTKAVEAVQELAEAEFGDDAAHLVRVEITEDGAIISLGAVLLFPSGSAGLQDQASPVLDEVANIIMEWNGTAEVRGHTDDLPTAGGAYPSNWELSLVRAASVVRYLESRGVDGSRLYAAGMGSTQPVVANLSAAHRYLNRRVEIDIVAED